MKRDEIDVDQQLAAALSSMREARSGLTWAGYGLGGAAADGNTVAATYEGRLHELAVLLEQVMKRTRAIRRDRRDYGALLLQKSERGA